MPGTFPLRYDYTAAAAPWDGGKIEDSPDLADALEKARTVVLADADKLAQMLAKGEQPKDFDPGFIDLPARLLEHFQADRRDSELARIRAVADRLRDEVDAIVVLGIGGSYMGARALFEACCHPYYNELSATERAQPKIYFAGNNVDNDSAAGLLDLLQGGHAADPQKRWAIVVISKSGGTLETAVALRVFLRALRETCGEEALARWVIPVTAPERDNPDKDSRLRQLCRSLGCSDFFEIPDGVGGRFSILTAVGLLPAALMGLDIFKLLEGAKEMTDRFRTAPPGDNPVLDYTGVCHAWQDRGRDVRILSAWANGLESAGLWYDQLLAESLGKQGRGALPLTVVNTRDLHSRGQQHQEGACDKLITNLIVDEFRRDPVEVGRSEHDEDQLNELAKKTLPDILAAALQGTNKAYAEDKDDRPTADLHLPKADEASLGQFFQMLMLATVLEGRLIGINPYGQPGVEAYKKNMNEILRGR